MGFESCWAKFDRAQRHREELEWVITEAFKVKENVPTVGTTYEVDTGDHVVYVSGMPDLTDIFRAVSLILGDCVHNLRSALDHVVYELATQQTKGQIKHPRALYWPITDDLIQWRSERDRKLREVHPDNRAIIERHQRHIRLDGQPESVKDVFALMRDLDDFDKHRFLTTVLIPSSGLQDPHPQAMAIWMGGAFRFLDGGPEEALFRPVELGAVLARQTLPGIRLVDMDMAGYIAPTICLPPTLPLSDFLKTLSLRVESAISDFSPRPTE